MQKRVQLFSGEKQLRIKDLDSFVVRNFIQYLSQKKTYKGENLSPATLKQIYALVKSFYIRCYEQGLAPKHPDLVFTKNLLRRYKMGQRKLPKYIGKAKMKKLLHACPDRWKALFHFMYDTGARISEVLDIQRQHLDLERKIVQIFEPKTMNIRVTTLSDTTIRFLNEYFSKYRPTPRFEHEPFVFINQQRRRMSPRAVQYIVKTKSAEILGEQNSITPHYFRAACAVHLLESGVDIRQVQEIIGWKSLSVVQNYTRVTPQRQAELKEKHHPGFQFAGEAEPAKETSILATQMKELQNEIIRHQQEQMDRFQQEISELREDLRQAKIEHKEEKEKYEREISDLRLILKQLTSSLPRQVE
ncbi:MAG: tyrosine-type recombinase/integrase [Candidatus Hodarchaeota archaeon]